MIAEPGQPVGHGRLVVGDARCGDGTYSVVLWRFVGVVGLSRGPSCSSADPPRIEVFDVLGGAAPCAGITSRGLWGGSVSGPAGRICMAYRSAWGIARWQRSHGRPRVPPAANGPYRIRRMSWPCAGVLGLLRVLVDGVDVTSVAPKERALRWCRRQPWSGGRRGAAHRGAVAGFTMERARHALQVRVTSLRKLLTHASATPVLQFVAPGYRLAVAADDIDGHRFSDLAERARGLLHAGDPVAAAALFREALAMWRGEPLADVQTCLSLAAEATRLAEQHGGAREDLAEAELACGLHREWVTPLETMVAEEPFRERRWALLMLALYRWPSGRCVTRSPTVAARCRGGLGAGPELCSPSAHQRTRRSARHRARDSSARRDEHHFAWVTAVGDGNCAGSGSGAKPRILDAPPGGDCHVFSRTSRLDDVLHRLVINICWRWRRIRNSAGRSFAKHSDTRSEQRAMPSSSLSPAPRMPHWPRSSANAFSKLWSADAQIRIRIGVHTEKPGSSAVTTSGWP